MRAADDIQLQFDKEIAMEIEEDKAKLAEDLYDRTVEACARAAHEANRAYCIALGDTSQVAWDEAPEWQRDSARKGVPGALACNTPRQQHEAWLATKQQAGWKYGPVKDPEKKEHPCMLPYGELPPEQRAKDHLYIAVVRATAVALEIL